MIVPTLGVEIAHLVMRDVRPDACPLRLWVAEAEMLRLVEVSRGAAAELARVVAEHEAR